MTEIYCVKCGSNTDTRSEKKVTKNGRYRLTGTCSICGSKKSMFISKDGKIKTPLNG